ncbi:MAG: hypothetical protein Fur0041_21080 [Bacteroidia bacterium]
MKSYFIALPLLALLFITGNPVGQKFPELRGETLQDKVVTLPADVAGKSSIICLAYSQDAEKDLKTWYEPAFNKFIAKTGLMDDAYDVHLYFVPMFTGASAAAASGAKRQMMKDVQQDLQSHVIVYRGELEAYKEKLGMDDKKKPYIFVLDKNGKVVYMTSGEFTEDKMDAVEDHLE